MSTDGQTVKVERQTEAGYDEVECPLPVVVTVTAGVVEPRYPSFKGIMAAKSKPVDNLTVADLGIDPSEVGAAGSGQEITDVSEAEARAAGEIVVDEGDGAQRIVSFLEQLKVIVRNGPSTRYGCWPRAGESGPTPITLELLTQARSVAVGGGGGGLGPDTAEMAAALGEYGATGSTTSATSAGPCPGCRWPRPSPPWSGRATPPTPSSCRPPTTAATWRAASRPSWTGRCSPT